MGSCSKSEVPALSTPSSPAPADLFASVTSIAAAAGAQARADQAAAQAAGLAGYRAALLTLTFDSGTQVGCYGLTAEEAEHFRSRAHAASPAERQANRAAMMANAWPGTEICFVPGAIGAWNVVETPRSRRSEGGGSWEPADALFLRVRTAAGRDAGLLSLDQPMDGHRPEASGAAPLLAVQQMLAVAAILVEEAQLASRATEAEGRLIQAQKLELLGELASEVAHDFNNLLAAISGYAELAELDSVAGAAGVAGAADAVVPHLRAIVDTCGRGATLSHRLLDFGAPGGSGPVPDLGRLLVQSETLLGRLAGRRCRVRIQVGPEPLPLAVNETVVTQILLNLVVNARQAMPVGGTIQVRASLLVERGTAFASLEVQDPGVGMSPEVQARIFEPYFTTREEGTGLGLATVQRLIHKAGGRIRLESAPGVGTTIRVHLPLG